jgi:NTP pyrophosphatase (non-canonical NTP hydrolase)
MNSNLMALCSEKVKKALNEVSGGLCYFTAEAKHAQLLDVQKTLSEVVDALASPEAVTQPPNALPARVLAMCKKRGWDLSWSSRGVYLHLEASELIEALRGKHGDPLSEAADVLLVLMSITENAGIPWGNVLEQTAMTCARLEVCDPYPREERGALAQSAPAQSAPIAAPPANGESEYTDQEWAEINRWGQSDVVAQPASPVLPAGGLVNMVVSAMDQSEPGQDGFMSENNAARAAILAIAAWLDLEGYNRAANDLRDEAGR